MHILIAVLLLILVIFGVAGMMDSYATAKQAQATIEVAQVAQVNAWGNLIVILLLALVILCVVAMIVWMVVRLAYHRRQTAEDRPQRGYPRSLPSDAPNALLNVETLVQLKTLEFLDRMSRSTPVSTLTPSPSPEGRWEQDDELGWLR